LTSFAGGGGVGVEVGGQRDWVFLDFVDGAYFATLELQPEAGRLISPDDDHSARPVVVISDLLWDRWFNRKPEALGSSIRLNGGSFTIIGVTPRSFRGVSFPGLFGVAVPMGAAALLGAPDPRGVQGGQH